MAGTMPPRVSPASDRAFRSVLDRMLEGCQIIGPDWRYQYVNDAVVRQARRSRTDLVGKTMMEAFPGIETTAMFAALEEAMSSRTPSRMLNQFTHLDGSSGWFELSIQPIDEGLLVMSLDVTAHKRAEVDLRRQVGRLDALRNIDLAILGTTDERVALRTVAHEARTQLGMDGAVILSLDAAAATLAVVAHAGFGEPPDPGRVVRLGEGLLGRAALERRTIEAPALHPGDHPGAEAWCSAGVATRSAYATPLIAKDTLIGVLAVDSRDAIRADRDWIAFFESLAGQAAMALEACRLHRRLGQASADLLQAYDSTIEGWSRALDLRDRETEGHTARVTATTLALAEAAGISEADRVHVRRGALLHDIGKMGVPDAILFKPGPLTDEEWAIMKRHPQIAYDLLSPIAYLRPALDIPYAHHEKWDGTGYPRGLSGEQIPFAARLFAVVDVWDALRSDRPYRPRWSDTDVLEYIRSQSDRHFDPGVVELFLRRLPHP